MHCTERDLKFGQWEPCQGAIPSSTLLILQHLCQAGTLPTIFNFTESIRLYNSLTAGKLQFSLRGFQLWLWNSHSLSIIISTSNAHYTFLGTWNQLKSSSSVLISSAFFGRTQTIFQRKDKRESKPYWQSQIQCGLWLGVGLERSKAKKEAEFIKTVGIPLFNLFLAASKSWIVWIKRKLNIPFMFIIHITKNTLHNFKALPLLLSLPHGSCVKSFSFCSAFCTLIFTSSGDSLLLEEKIRET